MNKIKVFKIVGIGLSVAGMLVTAFVGDKENKLQFAQYEHLTLNDYYSYLGIEPSPYGEAMGWSKYQMQTEEHVDDLEFTYERVIMSNGIVCYNIITNVSPTMDHFCF